MEYEKKLGRQDLRFSLSLILPILLLLRNSQAADQNDYADLTGRRVFDLGWYMMSKTPEACIAKYYPTYQTLAVIHAQGPGLFGKAQVSVIASTTDRVVYVFFRGAESIATFAFGGLGAITNNFESEPWDYGTRVGKDYSTTLDALLNAGLRSAINTAWTEYCDFTLIIGGYSLGSCLGQMLALRVVKTGMWPADLVQYYGYGSPRCGNQMFALTFDDTIPVRYRINNNEDMVPTIPSSSCPATDSPTFSTAKECYWHCCYPIKYAKAWNPFAPATISICAQSEAATCAGGINLFEHAGYFNRTSLIEYDSYSC